MVWPLTDAAAVAPSTLARRLRRLPSMAAAVLSSNRSIGPPLLFYRSMVVFTLTRRVSQSRCRSTS